ncbi:hypothetical protein AB0D42_32185 [Streptomyces sp. NPDC048304]|uniref:hypothetical protein n=1 Tax=Streptomyces sp. NPDC048304 TaxID=3154820 RepID=UPI0033E363B0
MTFSSSRASVWASRERSSSAERGYVYPTLPVPGLVPFQARAYSVPTPCIRQPPPGRDASEFLGVDVDQIAGPAVLAADDLAQMLAGRWVEVPEPVESSPHQDAVDGRGRECDAAQPL